jgi:hypothetical protein
VENLVYTYGMAAVTELKDAGDRAGRPGCELDDFDTVAQTWWPAVFRYALASLRDPDAATRFAAIPACAPG